MLNEDEIGVENDSVLNHSIYRRINSVYFVLVPTTNLRMQNAMILAFGGCFAASVGYDEVMWA